MHVVACVWSPLSRPNPSITAQVRCESFNTPCPGLNSAGGYFWMAGFHNGTITAFCCSDSARVDGMGWWWTNGQQEKKTHFQTEVVRLSPVTVRMYCGSLVSQPLILSVRAFNLFGIAAPKSSRIASPRRHLPVLDSAWQSRQIEKRRPMYACLL